MKRRAMLGAALAASLSPLSGYAAASKESYDVIVVGSGVAGLTAAVSASENGAKRVLLIEKNSTIGGHSILSTGYLSAVPEGSPAEAFESMFEGMQKLAHGRGNVALRRIMVRESGSALKWLTDMGLTWEQDVYQTLAGLAPRSYISSTVRAGYDYVVTLNKTAAWACIRFLRHAPTGLSRTKAQEYARLRLSAATAAVQRFRPKRLCSRPEASAAT